MFIWIGIKSSWITYSGIKNPLFFRKRGVMPVHISLQHCIRYETISRGSYCLGSLSQFSFQIYYSYENVQSTTFRKLSPRPHPPENPPFQNCSFQPIIIKNSEKVQLFLSTVPCSFVFFYHAHYPHSKRSPSLNDPGRYRMVFQTRSKRICSLGG